MSRLPLLLFGFEGLYGNYVEMGMVLCSPAHAPHPVVTSRADFGAPTPSPSPVPYPTSLPDNRSGTKEEAYQFEPSPGAEDLGPRQSTPAIATFCASHRRGNEHIVVRSLS
jgi:hypothetical protein